MTNAEYVEKYPERFKDELDKWLFIEFGILGGCCSSVEELKYNVAREVAKKAVEIARKEMMEKAIKWVEYNNENGGCKFDGWVEDIKQAMKDET